MADPIQTICELAGCSQNEAQVVYSETNDVVEAVDRLLVKQQSSAEKYIQSKKPKKEVTTEEKIIAPYRVILKEMDEKMSTSLSQHGHEGSVETLVRREETVLQNNCSQECQLPSLESEAGKQGTACQSQFECSCDSQSNVQIPPCSDLQYPQSCQAQETESSQMGERIPV
jgi:hypothetical protein